MKTGTIPRRYVPPKYFGIHIARLLVKGLVGEARSELIKDGRKSWRAGEVRAVAAAIGYVDSHYGVKLEGVWDFLMPIIKDEQTVIDKVQ